MTYKNSSINQSYLSLNGRKLNAMSFSRKKNEIALAPASNNMNTKGKLWTSKANYTERSRRPCQT